MSIKLSRANSGNPLTVEDYNNDNEIIEVAINGLQDTTLSDGTVTSVSDVDTDVSELFSTSIANPNTTPVTTFTRSTKASNLVYASPNGASGKGSFRSLVVSDLPTVTLQKGGTGLTSITPNKVLRTNNAGTAIIEGEIKPASSKTSVGVSGSDISIDVVPANIPIDGLDGSTPLSVSKGGTGQITAQGALNTLAQVSGATNESVLTKDTATGNVTFKVIPNVTTSKIANNSVTYEKIQQVTPNSIVGNPTGSVANPSEITLANNLSFNIGVLGVVPSNIPIDNLNGSTPLSIAKGGTGFGQAQNAFNALSQVSGAANESVLTKDTATGNAIYKAIPDVTTTKITNNSVTYAKIQTVAPKSLLGNPSDSEANTSEITLGANLLFLEGGVLAQRQSIIRNTSIATSMTIDDGVLFCDATTGGILAVTLPDTDTIVIGDIFTVQRTNQTGSNISIVPFDEITERIISTAGGGIEILLTGRGHQYGFQYVGIVDTFKAWRVVNVIL